MKTILELKQDLGKLYDEARAIIEKCDVEKRTITPDEETQYEDLMTRMDTLKVDIARREKLEGFTGVSKPQSGNGQFANGRAAGNGFEKTPDTPEGIYCRYLRTADSGAAAELRAYNDTDANITTAADGEVTVPVGMVSDIIARRDEMSLVPKLGLRRVPGKGTTVNYPIDNEPDVVFASVAESGEILQDLPAMTEKAFTLVKYGKHLTITWELLEDTDVALMEFFNGWVARGYAATQNSLLITQAYSAGTAGLTFDGVTVAATEIPELVGKLAPEYQNGAQWIIHPTTYAFLSGIASSSVFTFAPQPGGNLSAGTNLWGYPVQQSSYATTQAASAKSLLFGNWNFMGYREAPGLTTLVDPYTGAHLGQRKVWFWFRTVFGVLQAEAIQYGTHPSA